MKLLTTQHRRSFFCAKPAITNTSHTTNGGTSSLTEDRSITRLGCNIVKVFHGDVSLCSPSARDGSCGEDSPIKTCVLTKRRRIASDSDEEPDKVPAKNCETSVGKKLAKFKADVSERASSSPPAPRQSPKKEAVTEDTTDKSQGKVKQSCLEYNPDKGSYDPIQDASWRHGDKVPYLALAQTLEKIENVSARLKMIEILSNYFRSVIVLSPDDLLASIYLCLNKLAPAYEAYVVLTDSSQRTSDGFKKLPDQIMYPYAEPYDLQKTGIELGIAETTLIRTIAQSTGRSVAQVKSDVADTGDIGIVAEQSRGNQRMMFQPARLTVRAVFDKLLEIATLGGKAVSTTGTYSFYLRWLLALALACATTPPEQSYPPSVLNAAKGVPAETFKTRLDELALIIKTTYCTRKRKDATESDIKVQVCVYMFDLMYLNGESLVRRPLSDRRRLLREHFVPVEEEFQLAISIDTTTMEEVQDFLEESVKGNCEGLMVKTLEADATYEIAKRSRNWLKLKKDYLEGVGDTLDLVVLGAYLGRGKRVGTYGGFLLACYDQDSEEYQSICKIGTGFTDDDLAKHTQVLKERVIPKPRPYYRYDLSHEPDHWFDASQVWEVKCADLSLSPVHRAAIGIVDHEKGISLRFPRFLRVREDKSAEEATTATQVAEMYTNQDQVKNQGLGSTKVMEEDFY
uniref:DNA ligase 1 n=1 Tax=Timema bartmani TaxID=61472 RepID=A0A7R9I0S2_9NEOP|nr:unnamed protein product [Timema bartmani]